MKQKKQSPLIGFWTGNAAIFIFLWGNFILSLIYKHDAINLVTSAAIILHVIMCLLFAPFESEDHK